MRKTMPAQTGQSLSDQFERRLSILTHAIPTAPTSVQEILVTIHASARKLHRQLQAVDTTPILPRHQRHAECFDCGKTHMEVFHTSARSGYDLCPTCFQQRVGAGRARTAVNPPQGQATRQP